MNIPEKYNKPGIWSVKVNDTIVAIGKSKNMRDGIEQLIEGDSINSKRVKSIKNRGAQIGFDVVTEGEIEPFEQEEGYEWEPQEEWFMWISTGPELAGIRYNAEMHRDELWRLAYPEWIIPGELVRNWDKILRVVS